MKLSKVNNSIIVVTIPDWEIRRVILPCLNHIPGFLS